MANRAPAWAAGIRQRQNKMTFTAQPERAGGVKTRLYSLVAAESGSEVCIRERNPGTALPPYCPQRHINANATFCLGLVAGKGIRSPDKADEWWRKLQLFLSCQEAAQRNGVWPPSFQLSHGDAGEVQVVAELLATRLGLKDEYTSAVELGSGRIATDAKNFETARNVYSADRFFCSCPMSSSVTCHIVRYECLVKLEQLRKQSEAQFWRFNAHKECCNTMKECPLRK